MLSGVATAAFEDGEVKELRPCDLFHIGPVPHESWVVGDEPYVSLPLPGCEHTRHELGEAGAAERSSSDEEAGARIPDVTWPSRT